MSSGDGQEIKSMADLLRSGATLTDLSCPVCSSPIFKLRTGDLWCAKCEKKVVVVKEGESTLSPMSDVIFENLESTLLGKIKELSSEIEAEADLNRLLRLGEALSKLLENIERIRRIQSHK